MKAANFSWLWVFWVSSIAGVIVVVVITTISVVIVTTGVIVVVIVTLKLLVVVSQCMKLSLLNVFEEKTGQTPITQFPTPMLPSSKQVASA